MSDRYTYFERAQVLRGYRGLGSGTYTVLQQGSPFGENNYVRRKRRRRIERTMFKIQKAQVFIARAERRANVGNEEDVSS